LFATTSYVGTYALVAREANHWLRLNTTSSSALTPVTHCWRHYAHGWLRHGTQRHQNSATFVPIVKTYPKSGAVVDKK